MKVLYLTSYPMAGPKSGARDHVKQMVKGLADEGLEIELLSPLEYNSGLASVIKRKYLMAKLTRKVLNEFHPDIIYYRFGSGDIFSIKEVVRHKIPYVVELNTKTLPEFWVQRRFANLAICYVTESWIYSHAAGIAAVSEEIYRYAVRSGKKEKPFLLAKNGVDIDSFVFHGYNPSLRQEFDTPLDAPLLVMIGALAPWHGIDILLQCLETPELQNFYLWLVGNLPISVIKNMASKEVLPRVRLIPWQPPEDLSHTLSAADIGIGALAGYRKNTQETQALKTRTYLACGLPTLLGHKDPILTEAQPFIANGSYTTIAQLSLEIKEFYELIRENRHSLGEQARQFAEQHLSWRVAARETVEFLEEICSSTKGK